MPRYCKHSLAYVNGWVNVGGHMVIGWQRGEARCRGNMGCLTGPRPTSPTPASLSLPPSYPPQVCLLAFHSLYASASRPPPNPNQDVPFALLFAADHAGPATDIRTSAVSGCGRGAGPNQREPAGWDRTAHEVLCDGIQIGLCARVFLHGGGGIGLPARRWRGVFGLHLVEGRGRGRRPGRHPRWWGRGKQGRQQRPGGWSGGTWAWWFIHGWPVGVGKGRVVAKKSEKERCLARPSSPLRSPPISCGQL